MLLYQDLEIRRREFFVRSTNTTIPVTWPFIKDLSKQMALFAFVYGVYALRRLHPWRRRYTIGFYPNQPKPWYKIWNITKYKGLKFSEDIARCDILYYFEDTTRAELNTDYIGLTNKKAINGYCTDIGKDRVARVFEDVFGYPLSVNPTTYQGSAVSKSLENAAHDGRIVECPITEPEPGRVYQRLVDNSYDGTHVQDLRVPVVGSRIPIVYIKERRIEERFANDNTSAYLVETDKVFSNAEVKRIVAFAKRMGLDEGGLDVLRDRNSGRIYIVDVNKTCMGPPVPLRFFEKVRALHLLGDAFVDMIEEYCS